MVLFTEANAIALFGRVVWIFLFSFTSSARYYGEVGGTCFNERLKNGNCAQIIPGIHTKDECCIHNGYFAARRIEPWEYILHHLVGKQGTRECFAACSTETRLTCDDFNCPQGHQCWIREGRPVCECDAQCLPEDKASGLVCTTDMRVFSSLCSFKHAQCRAPHLNLEAVPCPGALSVCASSNLKRNRNSIFDKLTTHFNIFGVREQVDNNVWNFENSVTCSSNEYCMIHQFDGSAKCVVEDDIEKDCERLVEGPFCGADNQTYSNQFELRQAGILRGVEIRIAYLGRCRAEANCENIRCQRPEMTCRPHQTTGQPICLDCSVLPSDCNAPFARRYLQWTENQCEGDPSWNKQLDTTGLPMVCTPDKRIFVNSCFLHVASCIGKEFLDMVPVENCIDTV